MMTTEQQDALTQKKEQLAAAEAAYDRWRDDDARREDGSPSQDARHERIGESLSNKITILAGEVRELESQSAAAK